VLLTAEEMQGDQARNLWNTSFDAPLPTLFTGFLVLPRITFFCGLNVFEGYADFDKGCCLQTTMERVCMRLWQQQEAKAVQ